MSHGAQCMLCKHARWRGNRIIACLRFEASRIDSDVAIVLAALLFQAAGKGPCVAREAMPVHPDAYFAEDLPQPDEQDHPRRSNDQFHG